MRWFQVRKCVKSMVKAKVACEMRVGKQKYSIVRMRGKAAFRIVTSEEHIVAEVILFLCLEIILKSAYIKHSFIMIYKF